MAHVPPSQTAKDHFPVLSGVSDAFVEFLRQKNLLVDPFADRRKLAVKPFNRERVITVSAFVCVEGSAVTAEDALFVLHALEISTLGRDQLALIIYAYTRIALREGGSDPEVRSRANHFLERYVYPDRHAHVRTGVGQSLSQIG